MAIPTDPQQLAQACADAMLGEDNASRALGMTLDQVAPDDARLSMTVTTAMTNGHGTAHGGYIFTLADSAFAFACNTVNQRSVGQHASISYLAPAFSGDRLTAHARAVSRGPRNGIYDVRVTNQDGQVIAEFRGHSRTVSRTFFDT
ncbi:MAG: hydroxyphenylacetyl-CoA thioesterase PaaI [Paracoccus denitrificans]|nr:MAG: hydroxyphenylacetyl-CoA thioesterase PaaI [Paracoccus denitrificans]PZO84296.1 MAG: hydroxyphenylacetyl-CoA thioesterase PaaI [Paracoccus denitrificans]